MSTEKKTVFKNFGYLRCDDFAAYLEDMAAKGWHLESWGAGLKFRRGEPEQATYAVEVFSEATEYDTRPEPNTEEFAEYCEAAGWHLVDAKRKFVIFKKLRPDAHPIMTDQERLEAVYAEEKKDSLREILISGIWCVGQWADFLGMDFGRDMFMYPSLLLLVTWTMLFAAALGSFLHLVIWKLRTAKRIADGQMLHLGRGGSFQNRGYNVVLTLVFPLWVASMVLQGSTGSLVFVVVLFGVVLAVSALVAKKRPDAATNQIITTMVSMGMVLALFLFGFSTMLSDEPREPVPVPLTAQDLGIDATFEETGNLEDWSTVFGSVRQITLYYDQGMLRYTVWESDFDWVLDKIWKESTEASNWEPGDTAPWDAEEVRTRLGDSYVVRWEDSILAFYGMADEPLTGEQIGTVVDALRP